MSTATEKRRTHQPASFSGSESSSSIIRVPLGEKLDHYHIQFPLARKSVMMKIEDSNTLVFLVYVKANEHQVSMSMKKYCDPDPAKVSTLIGLDGEKRHSSVLTMSFVYCQQN